MTWNFLLLWLYATVDLGQEYRHPKPKKRNPCSDNRFFWTMFDLLLLWSRATSTIYSYSCWKEQCFELLCCASGKLRAQIFITSKKNESVMKKCSLLSSRDQARMKYSEVIMKSTHINLSRKWLWYIFGPELTWSKKVSFSKIWSLYFEQIGLEIWKMNKIMRKTVEENFDLTYRIFIGIWKIGVCNILYIVYCLWFYENISP